VKVVGYVRKLGVFCSCEGLSDYQAGDNVVFGRERCLRYVVSWYLSPDSYR